MSQLGFSPPQIGFASLFGAQELFFPLYGFPGDRFRARKLILFVLLLLLYLATINFVPRLFIRRSPTRWRKDPGSGCSRGHLTYLVLGEGWSKENRLIWLISYFEISIHSPATLISLLSSLFATACIQMSFWGLYLYKLFFGYNVATV